MKIHIPDHSILLNTQDAVQAICQFMFDELKFTHFDYGHYYDGGKNFTLTNDTGNGFGKTWLQLYYGEGIYITIDELEQLRRKYNNAQQLIGFLTPELAITDELPNKLKHRTQMQMAETCFINQRIYFGYRYKDYIELIGFGSNFHITGFHNFCMQNLPIFRNFIQYFRKQAKDIIEAAMQQTVITLPGLPITQEVCRYQNFTGYDFFNKRRVNLQLTPQEASCIQQLLHGKTFKETAKVLNLSPRTVEGYVNNIKNKSGYDSTSRLLDVFRTLTYG